MGKLVPLHQLPRKDARVLNVYLQLWTLLPWIPPWYSSYPTGRSQELQYLLVDVNDKREPGLQVDRWRLVVNPFVSGQSKAADQNVKKGWYRLSIGHGTIPLYEPDTNYGGAAYPSWMLGELPEVEDGEVERTAKFAGTSHQIKIWVKNCGEHYVY